MKNKKIIYLIIVLLVIGIAIVSGILLKNKNIDKGDIPDETEPKNLIEAVMKKNNKTTMDYKKFIGGEVLSTNTLFTKYTFVNDNTVYIFNPKKLTQDEMSYKKVYEIPYDMKVLSLLPSNSTDIPFIDDMDNIYRLHDNNIDNNENNYESYEKAVYELKNYTKKSYTEDLYAKKIDYNFITAYWYVKDNILYKLEQKSQNAGKNTEILKVSGNYEGEEIIKIYNERILKTDKGFYEILNYYDENGNIQTTTMKIDLLSKYYDEVLTFTYEYVILQDNTIIPIKDVITNQKEYQPDDYIQTLDKKPESFVE